MNTIVFGKPLEALTFIEDTDWYTRQNNYICFLMTALDVAVPQSSLLLIWPLVSRVIRDALQAVNDIS